MLQELRVKDFAIIESLEVHFRNGLNILSGETGAGKSVLLKGLNLLMGGKADTDTIRTGCHQALIEGSFELQRRFDIEESLTAIGIPCEDHTLLVRRIISSDDKNKVYLNGCLATLNSLREIVTPLIEVTGHSAPLIEMTGQHESRNLLSRTWHMELLDRFAGIQDERQKFTSKFARYSKINLEIQELKSQAAQREQRLDFLCFQRDEISRLNLNQSEDISEDIHIESEIKKLKSAEKLAGFVESCESLLCESEDSALTRIQTILKLSHDICSLDPSFEKKLEGLVQAKTLIEDVVYELNRETGRLEKNPNALENLQSRLSQIRKLQKKFGPEVADILRNFDSLKAEIQTIENAESNISKLEKDQKELFAELKKSGEFLHHARQKAAEKLGMAVNKELLDLNMKGVQFFVFVEKTESLNSHGSSLIEFMIRSNAKEPPRSMVKVASGGELSRILLSLKRILGAQNMPRTYLFDEVDTGVSGPTAEKVGKKLRAIAQGQQVICVTHLPQVAACGDHHFVIQKIQGKNSTSMQITELESKERVSEIARLISGETITKTSIAHAAELVHQLGHVI